MNVIHRDRHIHTHSPKIYNQQNNEYKKKRTHTKREFEDEKKKRNNNSNRFYFSTNQLKISFQFRFIHCLICFFSLSLVFFQLFFFLFLSFCLLSLCPWNSIWLAPLTMCILNLFLCVFCCCFKLVKPR